MMCQPTGQQQVDIGWTDVVVSLVVISFRKRKCSLGITTITGPPNRSTTRYESTYSIVGRTFAQHLYSALELPVSSIRNLIPSCGRLAAHTALSDCSLRGWILITFCSLFILIRSVGINWMAIEEWRTRVKLSFNIRVPLLAQIGYFLNLRKLKSVAYSMNLFD